MFFTGLVEVVFTLQPETLIVQSFWLDGTIMGEQADCQEIEKNIDLLKDGLCCLTPCLHRT